MLNKEDLRPATAQLRQWTFAQWTQTQFPLLPQGVTGGVRNGIQLKWLPHTRQVCACPNSRIREWIMITIS